MISFVRGQGTSNAVQIDHIVALSDAWQKGAQQLAPSEREELANGPLNLLAVDGPTNGSKGDGDAATWLPPNEGHRCEYVALQTAAKAKYSLWMTQAESNAIRDALTSSCVDQPITATGGVIIPAQPSREASNPSPAGSVPDVVSYANCAAVHAAGAAPIRIGDPGWSSKFDRNQRRYRL